MGAFGIFGLTRFRTCGRIGTVASVIVEFCSFLLAYTEFLA